jgi:hypothetical protein
MALNRSKQLSTEEFASLLRVSKTRAHELPAIILAEHSVRLTRLGYTVDLAGRLRMTSSGRWRIADENQITALYSSAMAPDRSKLSTEEYASLLKVSKTCAVLELPAIVPAEHSVRLIRLGYMVDLADRLRMTTVGRRRIADEKSNHVIAVVTPP